MPKVAAKRPNYTGLVVFSTMAAFTMLTKYTEDTITTYIDNQALYLMSITLSPSFHYDMVIGMPSDFQLGH
jgi:hypothetical protein